jgi:hypothetical protein
MIETFGTTQPASDPLVVRDLSSHVLDGRPIVENGISSKDAYG